jgi:hypothetical protein
MSEIVRCGNCGKDIGNRRRCPYCGVETHGPAPDEIFDAQAALRVRQAESQGRGARAVAVFAAALGVLLAAGIGIYLMAAKIPSSPSPPSTPAALDDNTAPAGAPGDSLGSGSTAIAPDAVRLDSLNQPLLGGAAAGATPASGSTATAASPAADGDLTEDQAIDRVAALPEVKAWMKLVREKSPRNKAAFRSEGLQMGRWLIQAYEDVNDGNGMGHTATFGWYEVDKKTGETVKSSPD